MAFLAAITNTKVYQKKTLHVLKSKKHRGVDVCVDILHNTQILVRTNHWNVLNIMDHLHWNDQDKRKNPQTMKIHRAQFPGKVQGILHVDSIMALNSLPITTGFDRWRDKCGGQKNEHTTRNIRQTVIQVLCAAVLPECLQLLGKLNDCTAASGAQGSLKTQWFHFFFSFFK